MVVAEGAPRVLLIGDNLGEHEALSGVRLIGLAGKPQPHYSVVEVGAAAAPLVAPGGAPHGEVLALVHLHPEAAPLALHW